MSSVRERAAAVLAEVYGGDATPARERLLTRVLWAMGSRELEEVPAALLLVLAGGAPTEEARARGREATDKLCGEFGFTLDHPSASP